MAPLDSNNGPGMVVHAPETFHFRAGKMHDSIYVQEHHDYVNDCESHEENPHLQDYLVVHHHSDHGSEQKKPTLERPCKSILHRAACASRHPCPETEANRHVKFHEVIVRDYGMILGDHPSCRMGPPVTLEWDYTEYDPLSVNEYEIHHSLRRPLRKLYLKANKRENMLLNNEVCSPKEVKLTTREVKRDQRKRKVSTTLSTTSHGAHEALEYLGRRIKSIFRKGEKKSKS